MAIKVVELPEIGSVKLQKRRGTRSLRLRMNQSGEVIVSQPHWLPYQAGIDFAKKHRQWIVKHLRPKQVVTHNTLVGKTHVMKFVRSTGSRPQARVANELITVHVPKGHEINHEEVQQAARRGAQAALKNESYLLKNRLRHISEKVGLSYKDVNLKFMKSKWGSCRSDSTITLNYRLLDLPYELIDYVIVHELAHTKHMNHSTEFWNLVAKFTPEHKAIRKSLKNVVLTW